MCKSRMQPDELLDMLTSITRKKSRIRGNLRMEALLESTQKWLDQELKKSQYNRKRKYQETAANAKKSRLAIELETMEEDACEDFLGLDDFFNNLKSVKNL